MNLSEKKYAVGRVKEEAYKLIYAFRDKQSCHHTSLLTTYEVDVAIKKGLIRFPSRLEVSEALGKIASLNDVKAIADNIFIGHKELVKRKNIQTDEHVKNFKAYEAKINREAKLIEDEIMLSKACDIQSLISRLSKVKA